MRQGKHGSSLFGRLSLADKCLPFIIILAMVGGTLLSVYVLSARNAFSGSQIVGTSVQLAVGMVVMMVPPLCKVEWENIVGFVSKKYLRQIVISLVINWLVCPLLMVALAWLTLFDQDEYRRGIIMIGMARCIAMVLVWNDIAGGDNTLCAVIVLVNSLLQVVLYAPYQLFFCYVISGEWSSARALGTVSYKTVAQSVAFFLGIPLALGMCIRMIGLALVDRKTYDGKVMRFVGPWALIGLLYTIVVIFIEKGHDFVKDIGSAIRCMVPLLVYFAISWFGTFFFVRWYMSSVYKTTSEETTPLCGCEKQKEQSTNKWERDCSATYSQVITQTFTAASNNFELSLAVAISLYGSGSKESIAAVFGPLIEVPVLLLLCFVALYFRQKFLWIDVNDECESVLDEVALTPTLTEHGHYTS